MSEQLSPENVSSFIDQILEAKDPATVGLRKILRKKADQKEEFPLHGVSMEQFEAPGNKSKILTDEEQRILQLEKKVIALTAQVQKQQEQARNAVQIAFSQGKAEGIKEGKSQGLADASAVYEKKVDELQLSVSTVLQRIEESKKTIFSNADHILLQLCTRIAKKILSSEISIRQDVILAVLKKALTYVADRERLVIRVSPGDLETVSGRKDFWIPVAERLKDIIIEADERIERGGCIVESNSGVVDARLGVQFGELTELIENVWENINQSALNSQHDIIDNEI